MEVIPISELGRPRIDVTVRITGLFRDTFPNLIDLIDDAVKLVAELDESEEENYLAANLRKDMIDSMAEGLTVDEARRKLGGKTFFVANMDGSVGLPRIRRYCSNIMAELDADGVSIDRLVGGLDEYAVVGERMKAEVDAFAPDMTIFLGICHAYPDLKKEDILITDQPRELANYLNQNFLSAVGEVSSHNMVMGATGIVHLETADTLREIVREM